MYTCIRYVVNNVTVTLFTCVCFAVTVEDLQVWWKNSSTRFRKLTGHRSGDVGQGS